MTAWIARLLLLAGLIAALFGFHHARTHRPLRVDTAREQGILLLGNGTDPATLDPHLATGTPEHHILDALFEGLVTPAADNPDGNAPGAAERWQTEDFVHWTFHLRRDGRWSDGRPVTSGDFLFAFERILSPALAADYAPMLYPLRNAEAFNTGKISDFREVGVEAPDDHTLRLTLQGPAPYLLSMLKHYAWYPVPRHVIERHGRMTDRVSPWTRAGHFVGNGAFQLKEWRLNHYLAVERNPHYWDAASVRLNGIHFFPIVSDATEERAYRDGQLHATQTLPLAKIPEYRQRPDCRIDPLLGVYFYRCNVTVKPLDDPRVRRALALALDRESLTGNVLRAGQQPAHGFTPPGCAEGYTTPRVLAFDPEQARRLLAEAGFPDGRGFPPLEILINTSEAHRVIAEAVQEMWKRHLNVRVGVRNEDWGVYLESQRKLAFSLSRAAWVGDYLDPSTFLTMWRTGDGNNNTGWSNPKYDGLLEASAREGDPARRFEILGQAERLLLDELPVLPVYWYVRPWLKRPEVQGWPPSVLDHRCYKAIALGTED
jgi:oligopeptide transport system substrate-binding protein